MRLQTLSVRQIAASDFIRQECHIFTDVTMEEHVLTLRPATPTVRNPHLYTAIIATYTPPQEDRLFGEFSFATRLIKAHDSLVVL